MIANAPFQIVADGLRHGDGVGMCDFLGHNHIEIHPVLATDAIDRDKGSLIFQRQLRRNCRGQRGSAEKWQIFSAHRVHIGDNGNVSARFQMPHHLDHAAFSLLKHRLAGGGYRFDVMVIEIGVGHAAIERPHVEAHLHQL